MPGVNGSSVAYKAKEGCITWLALSITPEAKKSSRAYKSRCCRLCNIFVRLRVGCLISRPNQMRGMRGGRCVRAFRELELRGQIGERGEGGSWQKMCIGMSLKSYM